MPESGTGDAFLDSRTLSGSPAGQKNALSVFELNEYIRMLLEGNPLLGSVWVRGEISNFTFHRSGHLYFSLKDAEGLIRVVMFRYSAARLNFLPEEGMKVLLHGKVTLYGKSGQYQITADAMQPDGIGAMSVAFEQLKRKLEAEGLFQESRKKPLPRYPEKIGVITSPTGAAIRDIIEITGRRFPLAELILYPALVQGDRAAPELCRAVRYFNSAASDEQVDVIILGRGGGSIEDLWAFNDENLARTVADSRIPVISAVGHETDFTICDFVADCRAPTPSAAAELAVPDAAGLRRQLSNVASHLTKRLLSDLSKKRAELLACAKSRGLSRPISVAEEKRYDLDMLTSRMDRAMVQKTERAHMALERQISSLNALNPLAVLSRGYCAVTNQNGTYLSEAKSLSVGDEVKLRFADGTCKATVSEVDTKTEDLFHESEKETNL